MDPDIAVQRRFRVEKSGQVIELDVDCSDRLLGYFQRGGGNSGDRMSDKQHPVERKYARVAHRLPEAYRRYIGGRDDAANARNFGCAGDIQLADQGMRPAAAQNLPKQHAGQSEVRGVDMLSRDLADAIQPRQALTGDAMGVCVHGFDPATDIRSAASATASTILRYPVHLHRVPAMASRISSRLGRHPGFSSRK